MPSDLQCCLQTTVIEEDKEFVHSYFDMPDEDFPVHRQSPWLLRITLNRDLMVDKKLSLEAIAERINTEFEDELHCIFNDDNAEVPALRVGCLLWPHPAYSGIAATPQSWLQQCLCRRIA